MFFHLQNSNSRRQGPSTSMAKVWRVKKPNNRPWKLPWGGLGLYILWCWCIFSYSPVGPANKIVSDIKLQLRTLRRNVWCRDIGKSITVEGYLFRKRYQEALHVHAHFGHWLSRWSADLVRNPSGPSIIREFQQNQTSKAYACWARDASGGWFLSGYARLLQCQYESKSVRTVLNNNITSQTLPDYF